MKIALQKDDSAFAWNTPPIVDAAQEGIERFWKTHCPECSEGEARLFIAEIERKIAGCLWIIEAGCTLGGKEGCAVFERLDEVLDEVKDLAMGLGEQKFGSK